MAHIRLRNPSEILTILPYRLGFHPADSLVVVELRGDRVGTIARVDLADIDGRRAARECLAPLARTGAQEVLLLAWEDRAEDASGALDHAAWAAQDLGLAVVDEMVVRDGRYWRAGAAGPWDPDGTPLPEPSTVPAVADFVALGIAPAPDRRTMVSALDCAPSTSASAMSRAVLGLVERDGPRIRSSTPGRRHWQRLLRTDPRGSEPQPTVEEVAALAVSLLDRTWRDGLIAWLCPGSLPLDALPASVLDDLAGVPRLPHAGRDRAPRPLPETRGPGAAPGPTPGGATPTGVLDGVEEHLVATRTQACLARLCRLLPDDCGTATAAVLCVTAHVAWWRGDGAQAGAALDRALRVDPGYRLAQLLAAVVGGGVAPAQARAAGAGDGLPAVP